MVTKASVGPLQPSPRCIRPTEGRSANLGFLLSILQGAQAILYCKSPPQTAQLGLLAVRY